MSAATPAQPATRACWCGNADLAQFGGGYRLCTRCSTLVSEQAVADPGRVRDEAADLYGANYFFERQRAAGFPDLNERARADLSERCAYWLRALLSLRPPPATTLELGCASGAFVALQASAGYAATGQDLSPAITALARTAFDIPVLTGPVEELQLVPASLDALILMDVLEHLPDPVGVLEPALRALREDGVTLLQLPRFDPALTYAQLVEARHPFLAMMLPGEHLYLYSEASVAQLLHGLGLGQVLFLDPLFSMYDMFLAASRRPLQRVEEAAWRAALRHSREGRIVEALVDVAEVRRQRDTLQGRLEAVEADRARRLELILAQQQELERAARELQQAQRLREEVPRWVRAPFALRRRLGRPS